MKSISVSWVPGELGKAREEPDRSAPQRSINNTFVVGSRAGDLTTKEELFIILDQKVAGRGGGRRRKYSFEKSRADIPDCRVATYYIYLLLCPELHF